MVFISYQMFHNNWLIEGSVKAPLILQGEKMADRYFKRPNGDVVKAPENQDASNLKSWEDRFVECDKDGKEIKKVVKKSKKKEGK